jgi:phosphatidylglycerol---prolipoprotein diacylglyceryl transferase
MHPLLIDRGRLRVYSYTAMLYVGIVAGLAAGQALAAADGLDAEAFTGAALTLLIPALIGARLLFIAQNAGAFSDAPGRIWDRAGGGATLYGGLAAAVALSPLVLPWFGFGFGTFWDTAVVTMLVAMVSTKVGCLMNGCCAGSVGRVPVQLVESGLALALIPPALALRAADLPPGAAFLEVVAVYGAARAAIGRGRGMAALTLIAALAALAGVLA